MEILNILLLVGIYAEMAVLAYFDASTALMHVKMHKYNGRMTVIFLPKNKRRGGCVKNLSAFQQFRG